MSNGAHHSSKLSYAGTLAMLALALAFPVGLMIFNPTLMFERGWEQYVGTAIYIWAVLALGRELSRLWASERSFDDAPELLHQIVKATSNDGAEATQASALIDPQERRVLPARLRQLACYLEDARNPSMTQLMELNRESSGLDQEQAAGRFTLTRYILYLLQVIGFIGTVEGISKALMNISKVLPMVKDLDGFMSNLTGVTSALQIAFDSTLLALFLSAALMLVQTLVYRRSEDLLARVDRWVVEHLLPRVGAEEGGGASVSDRSTERLGTQVELFARSVQYLPTALAGFERGADSIARIGADLEALGTAGDSLRRGVASLGRIEAAGTEQDASGDQLLEIRQGIERTCAAIESMSSSWAVAYERSSRSTQEQLARTLNSLKDAIDLLNVSMEQGNALYRNIVKKMLPVYGGEDRDYGRDERAA
jgi:hypothetical protein